MRQNSKGAVFYQNIDDNSKQGDTSKTNVSQLINVSAEFRNMFEMDSSANDSKTTEEDRINEVRNALRNQTDGDDRLTSSYSHVVLPTHTSASVHHGKMQPIDNSQAQEDFVFAALDSMNLPHSFYQSRSNTRAGNKNDKRAQSVQNENNILEAAPEVSRTLKQVFEQMLDYVITLDMDENNHKKVKNAVQSKSTTTAREKNQTTDNVINIQSLYIFPTYSCTLQSVRTSDVNVLYDLYTKFVVSHEDFASTFESAMGIKVDPRLKVVNNMSFAQMKRSISGENKDDSIGNDLPRKKQRLERSDDTAEGRKASEEQNAASGKKTDKDQDEKALHTGKNKKAEAESQKSAKE